MNMPEERRGTSLTIPKQELDLDLGLKTEPTNQSIKKSRVFYIDINALKLEWRYLRRPGNLSILAD